MRWPGTSKTQRVPIRDYPRLSRFYGLSPQELLSTPQNILWIYTEELPRLEAEEQLAALQASFYPHMSQDSRNRTHAAVLEMAGGTAVEQAIPIDPLSDKGKEVLAGLGVGVASS